MLHFRVKTAFSRPFIPVILGQHFSTTTAEIKNEGNNKFFNQFKQETSLDENTIMDSLMHKDFLRYMRNNFRVMPFLFSSSKVKSFKESLDKNENLQKDILEWYKQSQKAKVASLAEYPLDEFMTEKKTMMMKPFIQSYLEYLQENHP